MHDTDGYWRLVNKENVILSFSQLINRTWSKTCDSELFADLVRLIVIVVWTLNGACAVSSVFSTTEILHFVIGGYLVWWFVEWQILLFATSIQVIIHVLHSLLSITICFVQNFRIFPEYLINSKTVYLDCILPAQWSFYRNAQLLSRSLSHLLWTIPLYKK